MGQRAHQVMGAGFSQGQAIAINGSMNASVSAAGTTQATATAIGAANFMVTTAAAGSGVILPQGQPGDEIDGFNGTSNSFYVYPPTGAKFNNLSTNGGILLGPGTSATFKQWTTTQYTVLMSA